MQQINENIKRVFGDVGMPETISHDEFARLAQISPQTLLDEIAAGLIKTVTDSDLIPSSEYYRYVCERNLRESGEEPAMITHVLSSLR